jgi:hypothetical protein
MLSSHISQAIQPLKSDIPRVLTGFETQLADFTFNISVPTEAIVISTHRKYYNDVTMSAQIKNPRLTVIFQCQETGTYDYMDIMEYETNHKVFGRKYELHPVVDRLKPGTPLPKGLILGRTTSIKDNNVYATGLETNMAYMSVPGNIEDGYVVSESFCKRAAPLELSYSTIDWGRKYYPLNIYGTEDNYKPFPNIGEKIRADGLVFALREYNSKFDSIELSNRALMEVDMIHDIRIYGIAGAEVYDIDVESGIGESRNKPITPKGMEMQACRYINQISNYYDSIKKTYDRLIKENPRGINISPKLQILITRAIADKPNNFSTGGNASGIIRRTYNNNPLDEYRVVVRYFNRKELEPGAKISDRHGSKGVICKKLPDRYMPVDKDGNRADVISFAKASVSRLNPGQFYEHYINAASRDMSKWIRENYSPTSHEFVWNRLLAYYAAAAPEQYDIMIKLYTTFQEQSDHINSIIKDGIYLFISPTSEHIDPSILGKIETVIKPTYDRVSYMDSTGQVWLTKDKVLIGIKDMIVLEKTDLKPMAISSPCLQHHGLISANNKETRNSHPSKQQSTRVFGETETRLYAATMGGRVMAELMDMANNPESHRMVCQNIMRTEQPINMQKAVDRNLVPLGKSRILSYLNHMLFCAGVEIIDNK